MVLLLEANQEAKFAKENIMALKDIADKIKKKLKGEDTPEDTTFPKALKSDRTYRSTYGSSVGGASQEYPITDRQGRPELLDVEESRKRGYPATSDDRLIGARGVVTEYVEDFPNMKRSKAATEAEKKKKGGAIKAKKMASGGSVSSASRRADGCAVRGKTRA
jgi:hypothetical protein